MTRVSENSNTSTIQFAVNRAKKKLEDLQIKGSNLTNISKPSDNPMANVEALNIGSREVDNKQYLRNADFAVLQLNTTDKSLEELTDIMTKAKEIAISQSSDFYDGEIRKSVSTEVYQLYNQALSIANKRVGTRYIFAGHNTLSPPFNAQGDYLGNKGHMHLEVAKDFFVPINLNGHEIFFTADDYKESFKDPLQILKDSTGKIDKDQNTEDKKKISRDLASVNSTTEKFKKETSIFGLLSTFVSALETDDNEMIQGLLEHFDTAIDRLITLRTRVGSMVNSIRITQDSMLGDNVNYAEQKSKLLDADIAEIFSDIQKQQNVLRTTYQSGKAMLSQTLLDFLR